ncbi:hypothetical protein pb186bvf_009702 [Paramecium bursaria]
MISQHLHMTTCPAILRGDDNIDDGTQQQQPKKMLQTFDQTHIYDRLNQEAEIFKQNNEMLKNYYQSEELRACSFAPQTLVGGQEKRSLYEFLSDQQNHVLKVEQKLEQIKQAEIQRDEAHSYHPLTNEYKFQDRDGTVPTYERLYGLGKKTQDMPILKTQAPIQNQIPTIQEKSRKMVRKDKVEDILYQDAQRRVLKQKENQEQKTKVIAVNIKHTSNNSEKIVAQKFIREFENVIDWIFDQTGQDRPTNISFSIDYLKLGEILQRLFFLNQLQIGKQENERAVEYENLRLSEERALLCEIWSILRGDELGGVSKRNLCLFLLTLIGITDFKIKELPGAQKESQDYVKSIQPQQNKITTAHQPHDKPKLGKLDKDGNIIFQFEETKKIQKQFDILYRNRLACEELKKTNWKDENPYKPQINPQSKALAHQYRERILEETANLIDNQIIKVIIPENGQITHADLLVLQKKTQEYKLEQSKKDHIQRQMDQCPFRPKIQEQERKSQKTQSKHIELYQLAKPQTSKRDRTKEEIEFERQADDCTFQPGVATKNQNYQSKQNTDQNYLNRDVDKTVLRMRQARMRRDEVSKMLERGYNSNQAPQKQMSRSQSQSQIKATLSSRQKSQESQPNLISYPSQNFHLEEHQDEPNPTSTQQDDRIPLLFVDVNLAPNKTERIIVYEGDLSSELAAKFAYDHNLDEFMQEKLKELLDYQISGLLTKIDEEEGALSENDQ